VSKQTQEWPIAGGAMVTILRTLLVAVLSLTLSCVTAGAQSYFPAKIFDSDKRLDTLLRGWYGGQLMGLHEPSLFEEAKIANAHTYRFLWLRTFHHPIAIRVDIDGNGLGTLTTKEGDGAGGYTPGNLIRNTRRPLKPEETQAFLNAVKLADFWMLPVIPKQNLGDDGSEWVCEGVNHGKYHLATQWSPDRGAVYDIGLLAIQMAGLTIPKREMY
jgi:hypothetical protein